MRAVVCPPPLRFGGQDGAVRGKVIRFGPFKNSDLTGRSIPVVRLLWEQIDRVRFSAARHEE